MPPLRPGMVSGDTALTPSCPLVCGLATYLLVDDLVGSEDVLRDRGRMLYFSWHKEYTYRGFMLLKNYSCFAYETAQKFSEHVS